MKDTEKKIRDLLNLLSTPPAKVNEDIRKMAVDNCTEAILNLLSSQLKEVQEKTIKECIEVLVNDVDYWSNVKDIDGVDVLKLKLIPKESVKRNIKLILDQLKEK